MRGGRPAIAAIENVNHLARHVERSQDDSGQHEVIRNRRLRPMRGGMEHFFLRPRAGEKERYAAKRHHADRVGRERHRHQFPQPAHFPDVLFVMRRVNDRAGAEEQERFEKSVREQMHDAGRHAAHA